MISISDRTQNYLTMLEDKFDKEKFFDFIKDLLNLTNENIINGREQHPGTEQYRHYIESAQLYAKYQDNKRRNIGVIIIKLKDNKNPANARTLQRNFIAHLLSDNAYDLDASLAAIYSDTDDTWRLSFVKQEIEIEVGKLKTKVSPAKRYSYLFGKDEPNHTAKEQLLELLENNSKQYSIEEIEEKFSVEKVTKDFFERYKDNYLKLKEILENNEEFISEATRCDFTSEEFTKKLMGQIVFIYFLQKKGWLGVKLVPDELSVNEFNELYNKQDVLGKKILDKFYINYGGKKIVKKDVLEKVGVNEQDIEILSDIFVDTKYDEKWGTGEKRYIRTMFTKCIDRNKNFFDDYLEPFFYNGLNNKRKNQYFSVFNCKVPFLNGGLFEPLDNYMWESATFNIDNEIFSNSEENGILDFFDRYNFTMNEEEPLEKDVAVDPEMLGKIFENLLDVKDRKSKGAFYTPRVIVHYMCQESLANYLVNKVGVDYNEIKEFIQYGEMIRDVDLKEATKDDYLVGKTIFENIINIDKALENIKVADPAVGSGAFPLGMLNEIVKLRDILTSYMLIYNRLGLFDKKYTEETITNNKRSIYNIKWNTIKNSIYAVDIENSAVDITKLRLWLSIVVDQVEVPKSGPEPLPNLDCKIMQGNSLLDEYSGIKLIDKKFIDELKDRDNVKFNDGGFVKEKGRKVYIPSNQIQFGDGQKKVQIDDLINLKKELYGTNEPNRKKDLIERIQNARKELLKLNFVGANKEEELFKIDKSHNKPYFAWMLEFIEVFIENDGFDIVIGNPPYIDSEGMVNAGLEWERELISQKFKYTKGNWDIYIAFFELGLKLCNNHYSNLIYITPDKWISKAFGDALRIGIVENIKLAFKAGRDIFETAKVDSLVTCIDTKKHSNIEVIEYVDDKIKLIRKVPKTLLNEPYNLDIIFSDKVDLLEKIEEKSIKLETLYKCDNACATSDCYKLKEILESNPIYDNNKMYKLVNTGIIDKYSSRWGQKEMRYLKDNYLYPTVIKEKFHNSFPNAYGKKVNKSKIIIKGMTLLDGMIDFNGEYIPGKSTMLIEIEDKKMLKFISALVNSSISIFYIKEKYSSSSYNGGITFNKNMINSLPVVKSYTKLIDECVEIVDKILNNEIDIINGQNKIDNIFFKEFELNQEEINIVKGERDN